VIGLVLAFVRGWQLTLVMLCVLPLIGGAGALLAKSTTWGAAKRASSYSNANVISSQAIQNIRTVASFQAESTLFERYASLLDMPRRISIRLATISGAAAGILNAAVLFSCVP
jgi:ATP-binding cassette, subfamily B (MDR/TAP), member 1